MKKREDIVQKFSTFLSFQDQNIGKRPIWQTDLQLERHIKSLVQKDPEAKEEFWARHFLKILREVFAQEQKNQNSELSIKAGKHLSAFLQEACFWAAQKSYQKFKFIRHKYPLEEYFQMANSAASPPGKIFKTFNFEHPQTNMEGYAKIALIRCIHNTIYTHDVEAKREKFSDYGLLKDLSAKELREALLSKGINAQKSHLYLLAWQCLDKIYQPLQPQGSHFLNPPQQNHLKQIANCYNQRSHQLNLSAAPVSEEKIQEMLSICIQAARDYRTKRFLPLEDYDNISDPVLTPWETLVQKEEWEQVQSLVGKLFSTMPKVGQTMLKLWQGLNLTQTEIAALLKHKYPQIQKQYQVARYLARYTRNLLKNFVNEWQKIHPEISLDDEKDIEIIKESLNECLQLHCQQILENTLEQITELITEILLDKIPDFRNLALSGVLSNPAEVKATLIEIFQNKLETDMYLSYGSLKLVNHKINNFVDEWMKSKFFILNSEVRQK